MKKFKKMIRLGRTPDDKNIYLNPFDNQHIILTGRTRSGKSVALYNLLAQMRDKPIAVRGIDPTGVLLNPLGSKLGGPALRVLTLGASLKSEPGQPNYLSYSIDSILWEMDRRIAELLSKTQDKFTEFSDEFPLILVVLEEYPGTLATLAAMDKQMGLKASERMETKLRAAVQRIALEGLKVGVKLIIASQRADASLLTGVLRSQLTTRISFAQDADGLRMLHESITPQQIEEAATFSPGQGFVEIPGQVELTKFRADLITYEEYVEHFKE